MKPSNSPSRIAGLLLFAMTFTLAAGTKSVGQDATPTPTPTSTPTPDASPSASPAPNKIDNEIDRLSAIYKANADTSFLSDDTQYPRYLVYSTVERPLMTSTEQQRLDKQDSTPAGSGASTSAVSTGSVPWLFGFAVEHGALTQSVNDNIITFRGNVANLIKAINAKDYVDSYRRFQDNTAVNLISRASFSVSFVSSQGGTSTATGQSTLAGYSAHIDLYNHRDPRDKRYIADWADVVNHGLTELATSVGTLHDRLVHDHPTELQAWQNRTNTALATLTSTSLDDQVKAVIKTIADDYVNTFGQMPDIHPAIERVANAMKGYARQKGKVVDKIENSPILSVEYTNTRQSATTALPQTAGTVLTTAAALPDLSNINVIGGFKFVGRSQATFNAAATFFNSLPTGSTSGSVRDWRVSGQLDIPLPEVPEIGKGTLSLSGLFLSLLEEPLGEQVLVNGVAESRTGKIGLFQAKFTVPVKGAGVKIPISLTAANRTELVKEKDVRGSIGVTLDLDSIFSKSGSGK